MARREPRIRRLQPKREVSLRKPPIASALKNSPLASAGKAFRPLAKVTPPYLKNAWGELRQTIWPSRRESLRLTLAVFIFAVVFGLAIAGADKGLDLIFKKVVLK